MSSKPKYEESFTVEGDDLACAGSVSIAVKKILTDLGFLPEVIRRVAIVTFEAEINIVLYAEKGEIQLRVFPGEIQLLIEDQGPGIEDIELAMKDGFSTATTEMRELGFGAGMGLPNIRKNADDFSITSEVGEGTRLVVSIKAKAKEAA